MKLLILFAVCSLINVILSTLKTLIMVRSGQTSAMIINAVTYSFYTLVLKSIAGVGYAEAVVITLITNLVGVWISYKIMDFFKKDELWRITATLKTKEQKKACIEQLQQYNISFADVTNSTAIDIYSYTQEQSNIIKSILDNYKYKYFIQEMKKSL